MSLSRRELVKVTAGAGMLAAVGPLGRGRAKAGPTPSFRALVGIFLQGGHDGWNMAVPTDGRYEAYEEGRGPGLALPRSALAALDDVPFALHPSLAPLGSTWAEGQLGLVLNVGALRQPLTKALYRQRPDLRPDKFILHDEAQSHWQGDPTARGMFARIGDSVRGSVFWNVETNSDAAILAAPSPRVDGYFCDADSGAPLTSAIAAQLRAAARKIETRASYGPTRQAFAVSQCGYDTHADQVAADDPTKGRQAELYADLAAAMISFHAAMGDLGLADNVTLFTMSEFGRAYEPNWERGTDHAWGNNHLVLGGSLASRAVHGAYPDQTLGGPDDIVGDGRWIPSLAIEEYLAPIVRWYGVDDADLASVFPNWGTWSGRAGVKLFA